MGAVVVAETPLEEVVTAAEAAERFGEAELVKIQ